MITIPGRRGQMAHPSFLNFNQLLILGSHAFHDVTVNTQVQIVKKRSQRHTYSTRTCWKKQTGDSETLKLYRRRQRLTIMPYSGWMPTLGVIHLTNDAG